MSMSYPQQPAGQPAVPAQPAQAAQPVQQVVPQAGVPAQPAYQGTAPGYAPVPQGPVVQKVNRVSIILGVVGWALIGLTWPCGLLSEPAHPIPTRVARKRSDSCRSLR